MAKPTVHIRNWGIYRRGANKQWCLEGDVRDHPRFDPDTHVVTSAIKSATASELSRLHDGDEVETENTKYILVGENQNGASA